ncbi:DUF4870 domain-containing protein [Nesterenkonia ebinurensis]|uniref:DUF4870 domain-containing protein n=1 Tax=Nesterenkonia ebinurensis TaxID=2608252 RepID=UPI00123DC258|nr:DUF4870 domain-containing protein [Nesterenkonia ebinurensis]
MTQPPYYGDQPQQPGPDWSQQGGWHSGHPQGPPYGSVPQGDYPVDPAQQQMAEQPLSPSEEQGWGVATHLGGLLVSFLVPLAVWLIFRRRSRLINDHGRTAVNWELTLLLFYVVGAVLMIIGYAAVFGSVISGNDPGMTGALGIFGIWALMLFGIFVLWLLNLVLSIIGAVRAYRRQTFSYWAIPFIRP